MKTFDVTLRLTRIYEQTVTVKAANEEDAEQAAIEATDEVDMSKWEYTNEEDNPQAIDIEEVEE